MNVFHHFRDRVLAAVGTLQAAGRLPADLDLSRVVVEPPRDPAHGDLSSNVAMVLAKPARSNPRALAEMVAGRWPTARAWWRWRSPIPASSICA